MASILDMFNGGFTPADAQGNVQAPMGGFGKTFADNSNSIIGLGLGMLAGTRESPFGNALQGFQSGAQADQMAAYRAQLMKAQQLEQALKLKALGMPKYESVDNPRSPGDKILIRHDPVTGEPSVAQIKGLEPPVAPGDAGAASLPPSKHMREQLETQAAKQQGELVDSARAAAAMKPNVDAMIDSYKKMMDAGAIGPVAGTIGRVTGKLPEAVSGRLPEGFNREAEEARQEFERNKAPVQAYITSAQNKGQGAVSEWERKMYMTNLPGFTELKPAAQLKVLESIRDEMDRVVKTGKASPIAGAPAISQSLQERPTKPKDKPTSMPTPDEAREELRRRGKL